MKTSEFIKKVTALGFNAFTDEDRYVYVSIQSARGDWFICVGNDFTGDIDIDAVYFKNNGESFKKVTKLAVDYAFTPIKEREDEPKFYVHLFTGGNGWLNWNDETGELGVNTKEDFEHWHSQFTEQQYIKFQYKQEVSGHYALPDYSLNKAKIFVPVEEEK
ncbi:hypothetical protein IWT140_01738 [Secundilactobacillus pentosiphilus]|uniref:Uncharacterized protein n=1 Tax=Secundilactobacillus pentosiphilus TaxID=1714682 RepID=A0A1Z5IRP8_9LACO|nr:hypothetical protein [Secundilactobacillus pentosiphilus]GAX04101.1 hypothetical protein IWT140_01738 [Secundilactobacillus pentosiphilus]